MPSNSSGVKLVTNWTNCLQQDFLGAVWNTSYVYPYSGAIGLGMGTPTFGTHYLQSKTWSSSQWGYIGAIHPNNRTVLSIGGPNSAYVAINDAFATYNVQTNSKTWTINLGTLWYNNGASSTVMAGSTANSVVPVTFDIMNDTIWVPPGIFGNITTALQRQSTALICNQQ